MRQRLSHKYIRGHGIEVGGLHAPLPVLPGCHVDYVDRMSLEDLKKHMDRAPAQTTVIVDDAEKLLNFEYESLDFIIANHVFEHCRSPLETLCVWANRLRRGGIVYAAIPEKNHTFDRPRAVTPFAHLLADFGQEETDDEAHYREWISIIDGIHGDELERRVRHCVSGKVNIHFHVWDRAAMDEIFRWSADIFDVAEVGDNGAEIIWILRKK